MRPTEYQDEVRPALLRQVIERCGADDAASDHDYPRVPLHGLPLGSG